MWVNVSWLELSCTLCIISSHLPTVLLRQGLCIYRVSASLLQGVGALRTGHRDLYLLEVRTAPGPETGKQKEEKKGGKSERWMGRGEKGRREGRGTSKAPLEMRGLRPRALTDAVREGFLDEVTQARKDSHWEN